MNKVLRCDCGFEVRADDEDALVAGVQRHALDVHGMRLSREDVGRLTVRAERGDANSEQRGGGEIREGAS